MKSRFRNFALFFFVSFISCMSPVGAQDYANTLKLDAFHVITERYNLSYERAITSSFTAQVSFEYGTFGKGTINGVRDYTLSGLDGTLELRYYPFSKKLKAPLGFFIGENFRRSNYDEQYNDLLYGGYAMKVSSQISSFNICAGYKFKYRSFCIEPMVTVGVVREVSYGSRRDRIPTGYSNLLTLNEPDYYFFRIGFGYMF